MSSNFDFGGLSKFVANVNLDEINKSIASEGKVGNFLGVGTHTLKVKAVDLHKNRDTQSIFCANDKTFFNVRVTLADEQDRSKDIFLQIPTSKLTYNETNSKAPFYVFRNLCKFMAGIGVDLSVETVSTVIPTFFATDGNSLLNPEKMIRQKITVDIGFSGNHIRRNEDGTFSIVVKKKALLEENGKDMEFATADAAAIEGASLGYVKLARFPEITTYHQGEYVSQEKPKPKLAATPW